MIAAQLAVDPHMRTANKSYFTGRKTFQTPFLLLSPLNSVSSVTAMSSVVPTVTLNNGFKCPVIGLGTWLVRV